MAGSVDPQAQQLLDGKAATGVPPLWKLSPDEARAETEADSFIIPAGPDLELVRHVAIPARGGQLRARVYSPAAGAPGVVVYYHGGGWVTGSLEAVDPALRALAVASGCDVVSVEYRLAPEHPFPAATDDAYDALAWIASPAGLAGGRPVVVAGDGAGGNLAAVSALRARASGGPALALQVLVCPVVDCDLDRRSYLEHDSDEFILSRPDMAWSWDHYMPDRATRHGPHASPLRVMDLSLLPPAYIITAEHDPLRDEGAAYASRLRQARVPVEHRHFGSQVHGFFTFTSLLDDADQAVSEAGAAIRTAVAASAGVAESAAAVAAKRIGATGTTGSDGATGATGAARIGTERYDKLSCT